VNTDPVRDEAERLVAAAIAALSVASRTLPGLGSRSGFATGSAECCVCPVCRTIAAMREPDPEFAERVASGAADLATGVAGLLRSLSRPTAGPWSDRSPPADEDTAGPADADDPWHQATTAPPAPPPPPASAPPRPAPSPKPMAKKAVKKAAKQAVKKAAATEAPAPKKAAKKAVKKAAKKATGE
jgi:hypothetical protein